MVETTIDTLTEEQTQTVKELQEKAKESLVKVVDELKATDDSIAVDESQE